jgi:pyruvate-formate lyase
MKTAERPKEHSFLEALRDHYYVNSTLTYAAHKAGMSLGEAIDVMKKYQLPQAEEIDNSESIKRVNRLLKERC